jgi:hypothetical protein
MKYSKTQLRQNKELFRNKIENKIIILIGHSPELNHVILPIGKDYIYGTVNNYKLIEEKLLNDTGRHIDFLYCANPDIFADYPEIFDNCSFPIITNYDCLYNFEEKFIENTFPLLQVYDCNFLNSLSVCLFTLMYYNAKEIRLYGFSGFATKEVYYNQKLIREDIKQAAKNITDDTQMMNHLFWPIANDAVKFWGPYITTKIINYTKHSKITCFPFAEEAK